MHIFFILCLGVNRVNFVLYYINRRIFTFSVHRATVAENVLAADGVMLPLAGVTGIALDGVDHAVLAFFHDADVIAATVALPIKEDQVARLRQIVPVLPLSVLLEPCHAVRTERGSAAYSPARLPAHGGECPVFQGHGHHQHFPTPRTRFAIDHPEHLRPHDRGSRIPRRRLHGTASAEYEKG